MPAPEPVAAVVLAAGTSTRMGRNKLLLELAGETLVRRTVRVALAAGLDPVIAVLGHEAPRVGAELADLPCLTVVNPRYAEGVRTSLHAGVTRAASAGVRALVVVLADMPYVTAAMITTLLERYRKSGAPLVVSCYGSVDAPPILYDRSLFDELLAVQGERCAKQVVRRHRERAEVVAWPEAALRDIDVAQDYDDVHDDVRAQPPR
jgi:molybdenum cofactor cytidylyltransferase